MQESEYKKLVSTLIESNIGQKTIDCIIKRLNDEDRTTGDTIYRQDAIDCVSEMLNGIFVEYEDIAKKAIGKLSSAQLERKKDIIQRFHDYQVEWLTSHCDIEFVQEEENLIIRFLHDTANCFMMEMERVNR